MKNPNIKPIVFSVVAMLLCTVCLVCAFLGTGNSIINGKNENTLPHKPASPGISGENSKPTVPENPSASKKEPPSPPASQTTSPSSAFEHACILQKTAEGGQSYIDSLTFLGDSTTYGMISAGVLSQKRETNQVWYGPGGTLTLPAATSHFLNDGSYAQGKQLAELAAEKKPDILVITLGVGVSHSLSETSFKQAYSLVIDTVLKASPDTKIICNSIYPVCRTLSDSYKEINNPAILKANRWTLEVACEKYDAGNAVFYLDSHSILTDNEGYLPDAYSNGDGLHLSAAAFNIILRNLSTHKVPN